jgi:hypothetical protein
MLAARLRKRKDATVSVAFRLPRRAGARGHQLLKPIAFTIVAQRCTSSAKYLLVSGTFSTTGSKPAFANRSSESGSFIAALISAFSFVTTASGVLAGANTPTQEPE